eukprot:CAMPEP_0197393704 /NCGR_PEP_ID=MMETSP1165-20131217/4472_1 /TAXON_ID=284809 /ORGANISM="Chrysocystis fragilis, Strain CCMP3189" /LENGTH=172 /DNA_ID=CAMNT_0042919381 /DNA_START=92 /DNA_END=607 /DNA_ORIENTATION=-
MTLRDVAAAARDFSRRRLSGVVLVPAGLPPERAVDGDRGGGGGADDVADESASASERGEEGGEGRRRRDEELGLVPARLVGFDESVREPDRVPAKLDEPRLGECRGLDVLGVRRDDPGVCALARDADRSAQRRAFLVDARGLAQDPPRAANEHLAPGTHTCVRPFHPGPDAL